jgi:hypothetical protein
LIVSQAIVTKYLNRQNHQRARVRAVALDRSTTVYWDEALSCEENHRQAAEALQKQLEWPGELIGGSLPAGGYAWVSRDRGKENAT